MTDLSPAAQAILDAYQFAPIDDHLTAAAVLKAAAQQMAYEAYGDGWFELVVDVSDLYAIADELEQLDD
jgi:hypothetical protein